MSLDAAPGDRMLMSDTPLRTLAGYSSQLATISAAKRPPVGTSIRLTLAEAAGLRAKDHR